MGPRLIFMSDLSGMIVIQDHRNDCREDNHGKYCNGCKQLDWPTVNEEIVQAPLLQLIWSELQEAPIVTGAFFMITCCLTSVTNHGTQTSTSRWCLPSRLSFVTLRMLEIYWNDVSILYLEWLEQKPSTLQCSITPNGHHEERLSFSKSFERCDSYLQTFDPHNILDYESSWLVAESQVHEILRASAKWVARLWYSQTVTN